MPTLYLTEDRALVRRDSEDCLLVQIPERRGKDGSAPSPARQERIPLVKIDDVVVMGEVTMTASALHLLLDRNIEINFLSYYGKFKGRMSQYKGHADMSKRCELARRFVIGKLSNQRQRLQRYNRSQSDLEVSEAINQLAELIQNLETLPVDKANAAQLLASGDNRIKGTPLEMILGIEGAGSAAYFSCFSKLITNPEQWPFARRIRRPPTDPVNSLLSFGYSLLTNQVASAVQLVGLDHYVGYLHSSVYGRPALALDIMEEFRPVIVDSMVLTLLNHRMLTAGDFVVEVGAFRLKDERRKVFFTQFEERLNEEVIHPIFGYKVKYRRCIELQVRLVAKFLTGEIDVYPPFLAR